MLNEHSYHGFVTTDALVKGLRCKAIATVISLKGLSGTHPSFGLSSVLRQIALPFGPVVLSSACR